jgi:hypothetical protein
VIYMQIGDQYVIIVEPSNLVKLREGLTMKTPDEKILVTFCPDIEWLSAEIEKLLAGGRELDAKKLDELIVVGLSRDLVFRSGKNSGTMRRVV